MIRILFICLLVAGAVKAGAAAVDTLQTAQAVKVAALQSVE